MAPQAMGTTVQVSPSDLGDIVTDGDVNTLYLFMPDNAGPSVCTDQCAEIWPPLTGDVTAGNGLDASLLGSAARPDGTTQATYNGWPLYYFANDAAPGDTNGQGVNDVWWTVSPTGDAMKEAASDPFDY
jgi:predicted lipoprotein with Yx(FWY)xxD motif